MEFPEYKMNCAKEEALQDYLVTSDILEDIINAEDVTIAIKLQQFIILKNKGENEEAELMFDEFIKALSKENNDFYDEAYKSLYNDHQESIEADREFWEEESRQSSY